MTDADANRAWKITVERIDMMRARLSRYARGRRQTATDPDRRFAAAIASAERRRVDRGLSALAQRILLIAADFRSLQYWDTVARGPVTWDLNRSCSDLLSRIFRSSTSRRNS